MTAKQAAAADPAVHMAGAILGHQDRRVLAADVVLRQGERVLILGPNGSGKSTLLATLAGLHPALHGEVQVLGLDPMRARRRLHALAGHLGHADPFYDELTGRENLALHARLRRLERSTVDERIAAVGLARDAARRVGDYSHGMRRRLGVAKATLGAPVLLMLDEPDDGLDEGGRRALRHLLGDTQQTVLLSTHHPETYTGWATTTWRLEDGRIQVEGAGATP